MDAASMQMNMQMPMPAMKSAPMQQMGGGDRFTSQMYQMASRAKRSKY